MKLRFVSKKQESGDVWSFFFEPAEPLEWIAGQSIRLEIPRKSWGYDERRFTIASAPFEKTIRITTRVSKSEFKQNLKKLKPGAIIDGHNIEGNFVWEESIKPKLFLAAGIGITPFRSMIAQAIEEDKPLDTTLLYSSKDQPAVFGRELEQWSKTYDGLRLVVTGERIRIDPESTLAPQWLDSLIYVSGPEQMVAAVSVQLTKAGLPQKQLRQDLFTGNLPFDR